MNLTETQTLSCPVPGCDIPRLVSIRWWHTDEHGRRRELRPIPATFLPFGVNPRDTGILCGVR